MLDAASVAGAEFSAAAVASGAATTVEQSRNTAES